MPKILCFKCVLVFIINLLCFNLLYTSKKIILNSMHVFVREWHHCLLLKSSGATGHVVMLTLREERNISIKRKRSGERTERKEEKRKWQISVKGRRENRESSGEKGKESS